MKLFLLHLLMAICVVANVFCDEIDRREELDYFKSGRQIQDGRLSTDPFREIFLRMTRKPRPHQFIGLMGKRSMGHKINSFVGLMGKRREEPDFYERSTMQMYAKRR
ncbi:protachykinin-1 [Genypterus blacodes]|uniref:protachykinin-1 n=1 Tax=Genypterus blacodes TaxID=154954 RepID=UPI003F7662AC